MFGSVLATGLHYIIHAFDNNSLPPVCIARPLALSNNAEVLQMNPPSNHPNVSEPLWPVQRNLERYQSLLGIDIAHALKDGGMWIDIGPGIDALPMIPFIDRDDVQLNCIGTHPRSLNPRINFEQDTVPSALAYLHRYSGRAKLVTDIYASVSYSTDPYLALTYCTLLLEPAGTCGVFTELNHLGDLSAWDRAVQFFRTELNADLSFHVFSIFEDASKSNATALRLHVKRHGKISPIEFDCASLRLRQMIGVPSVIGTIWEGEDKSARIYAIHYRVNT